MHWVGCLRHWEQTWVHNIPDTETPFMPNCILSNLGNYFLSHAYETTRPSVSEGFACVLWSPVPSLHSTAPSQAWELVSFQREEPQFQVLKFKPERICSLPSTENAVSPNLVSCSASLLFVWIYLTEKLFGYVKCLSSQANKLMV